MVLNMETKFKYGNWIRKKTLVWLGLNAFAMAILAFLPLVPILRILAAFLSIVLLVSFLIPLYAYILFSPHGGNMQEKLYNLII